MKILYSIKNNHPADAVPLVDGVNLIPTQYSIFSDVPGTFDLLKDGVRAQQASIPFFPHAENGAPFDLFGSSGTNANMFTFTQGNWEVKFTPKTGAAVSIKFTVGTVTPPPPPPATEEITEMYIENGQDLVVKTALSTYKVTVVKL